VNRSSDWGQISEVKVDNVASWAGRTFLTCDMDWAHDDILRGTHQILAEAGIPSTWFVTHDSPLLAELRADPNVELGIHPDFNKLLDGDHSNGRTPREVIERLLEIVPEAKAVRAHSLLQSSKILDEYAEAGLTHEAGHLVEPSAVEALGPWRHWNGLIRVPLLWEDDVAVLQAPGQPSLASACQTSGESTLRQLNFHPIHVFLNTEDLSRYERTRSLHGDPRRLQSEQHVGIGVRTLLKDLIAEHPS